MGSMREDFEAVFEEVGADEAFEEQPEEILDGSDDDTPDIDETDGDDVAPSEGEAPLEAESEAPEQLDATPSEDTIAEPENKNSMKAPLDWTPSERQDWSKIPRNLQEKIVAREKQMTESMANTREARNTHDVFTRLAQNYAPVLAAEGVSDPMQAVEGLFKTVAGLRMGNQIDRARIVKDMISTYGVDISTLDSLLVGESAPQMTDEARIQQLVDQRLAPIMQERQSLAQQQQHQQQESAKAEIRAFAEEAEFLGDVREEMADLIDMAEKRGVNLSLQDAYRKACALDPEISSILDARKQEEQILQRSTDIASKRDASSSIVGRRAGNSSTHPNSIRDSLEAAWGA